MKRSGKSGISRTDEVNVVESLPLIGDFFVWNCEINHVITYELHFKVTPTLNWKYSLDKFLFLSTCTK